ncbi:MAG: hypothetical protein KC615_02125 [Anaerolineae bacterium]|nr:hypothetical protein [Anaerolineae bacterium]
MRYRHTFFSMVVVFMFFGAFALVNPVEAATTSTSAAFQSFEGGFMIWEASEGGIWVLENGGKATYFPQSVYANRPDNPVTDSTPVGRVKPINGFGKVWGNFNFVRSALGWAFSGETGYIIRMTEVRDMDRYLAELRLSLPSGGDITINPYQRSWTGQVTPVPTPSPTPDPVQYIPPFSDGSSLASTLQTFENGFMIWIAGTGDIFVFHAATHTYQRFAIWQYAGRQDNPVADQPPAGLIKPIFGFGKVWGNFWRVRESLGWAISGEQGVLMPFTRATDANLGHEIFAFETGEQGYIRCDPTTGTWLKVVP